MKKHQAEGAIGVETIELTKHFGSLAALNRVSLKVRAGSLHALLGENGAGKSTLVKCLMGFYRASSGQLIIDDKQRDVPDPRAAHALGLGMVYQHFTLVPSLTATENLIINRPDCPRVIRWRREQFALEEFLSTMPFRIPMSVPVHKLAAGQKQKLEIIKQLYLGSRFLVLDEPTSVLTPDEADEVLLMVKSLCDDKRLTVLMITHKFREVTAYADTVSVLRQGCYVGGGSVSNLSHSAMADMMMGEQQPTKSNHSSILPKRPFNDGQAQQTVLVLRQLIAHGKSDISLINIESLEVMAGEIVGVAGISGNGQSELMEILTGQRHTISGDLEINGKPFQPTRQQTREAGVRFLPEEPLLNASAAGMSIAENIALRVFDEDARGQPAKWLNNARMRKYAEQLITDYNVKTTSPDAPMSSLSGGNVQRACLARELTGNVKLLIVSNPCFGLDFSAVYQIRQRISKARDDGAAVLLISEDLDEILELSDRIVVMSEGEIKFQCRAEDATPSELGHHMAGQISDIRADTHTAPAVPSAH